MHFKNKALVIFLLMYVPLAKGQILLSLLFGDKLNNNETSFGLHIDNCWSNISGIKISSPLRSFNLGSFLTYQLNNKWRVNAEIMFKYNRGASGMAPYSLANPLLDSVYKNGNVSRKIGYIALPITTQYLAHPRFYLEAGGYLAIRTKTNDTFTRGFSQGTSVFIKDARSFANTWDVGLQCGLGMLVAKAKQIAIGCRYSIGLVDVIKNTTGRQVNKGFYIYANVPIGKVKAEKKKALQECVKDEKI